MLLVLTWGDEYLAVHCCSSLLPRDCRALRAHRFTTSCWTFVALWLLLLVSELRVINQVRCRASMVGHCAVRNDFELYRSPCNNDGAGFLQSAVSILSSWHELIEPHSYSFFY